jgi:hypothetical protein
MKLAIQAADGGVAHQNDAERNPQAEPFKKTLREAANRGVGS